MEPLASKIRPKKFSNIYGQDHLIGTNGPIFRMVKNNKLQSLVLYGEPGIGKTTLAIVIANELNRPYQLFNASNDNKATLKEIIDNHSDSILIIDEIHRMKKDIQDYLLPHPRAQPNANSAQRSLPTYDDLSTLSRAVRRLHCQKSIWGMDWASGKPFQRFGAGQPDQFLGYLLHQSKPSLQFERQQLDHSYG